MFVGEEGRKPKTPNQRFKNYFFSIELYFSQSPANQLRDLAFGNIGFEKNLILISEDRLRFDH